MTDYYELSVVGRLGPVLVSYFPGFSATTLPPTTLLAGSCSGPGDFADILGFLTGSDLTTTEVYIERGAEG